MERERSLRRGRVPEARGRERACCGLLLRARHGWRAAVACLRPIICRGGGRYTAVMCGSSQIVSRHRRGTRPCPRGVLIVDILPCLRVIVAQLRCICSSICFEKHCRHGACSALLGRVRLRSLYGSESALRANGFVPALGIQNSMHART